MIGYNVSVYNSSWVLQVFELGSDPIGTDPFLGAIYANSSPISDDVVDFVAMRKFMNINGGNPYHLLTRGMNIARLVHEYLGVHAEISNINVCLSIL